ncbi:GH92 family glycosyl hydrolase [Rhodocytophaga aerolata]|uniref:GH92 family glycosyl hydrolase n=1 Tax=Rhodocytophaga aerolata TaxID=455078 RepID=A0ABT8R6C1_9BACT|nr:GH92 family glycosyl hydrolase [Rhodocytophaga aerolata]MDO1447637.1 GH92 family glycosyl hydrolase [Rhodocytophaga aerolata]
MVKNVPTTQKLFFKLVAFLFGGLLTIHSYGQNRKDLSPIQYVNPLIGTAISNTESAKIHSEAGSELKGQTFPAVGVPHGMTHWTPQTRATERKCLSPYYYEETRIQGFRGSHWMSGSCTQDYGSVTIMPMSGTLKTDVVARASAFDHKHEKATPAYYSVKLDDYQITAELTGTSHAGFLRFTYAQEQEAYLIIEPNSDEGEGYVEIDAEKNEISGYNPVHRIYQGWGKPAGFSGYFVAVFDHPFAEYGSWQQQDSLQPGVRTAKGTQSPVGAYVRFASEKNLVVQVKIGHSFTSLEAARKNLNAQIKGWNFEGIKQQSERAWNSALSKIQVKGSSEKDKIMFYTALYHTKIIPRIFSDADGTYPGFADDEKVYTTSGYDYYEDFSLWDTYRAVHPLLTLLEPKRTSDMVNSLLRKAEQGSWLPIFPCWNSYTAAMIGDHALSMIGDAYIKNIEGFDAQLAYEVMRKNAFEANTDIADYKEGKGRRAMDSYLKYGYIPLEDSVPDAFHKREQVSRTLEYAYDDFVLAQVAKKLGKEQDYQQLIQRAANYKHVFDTSTGYVRGRYADGRWIENFDPFALRASFITEGSPYQYTWYVPHDVAGLIQVMGGKEKFINRLDTLFEKRYYWHGNEPGHQTAYLYAYAGIPWKTQQRVRDIIREEYSSESGGLSGNEDSGQMSAWLVFSMAGFYPVCPGMPYYVLGSPMFDTITLTGPAGRKFTIQARKQSDTNRYIQSAKLNNKPFTRSYLLHEEIANGGQLVLEMGSKPNPAWGNSTADLPPSMGMGE